MTFDREIWRRAVAYHQKCDQLVAEIALAMGVTPAQFEEPFEKWLATIALDRISALEIAKARALSGRPMLWDGEDG